MHPDQKDCSRLTNHRKQRVITLRVGKRDIAFYVHEFQLHEQSSTFLDRLSTTSRGTKGSVMTLPDVSTETMDMVVHWLYTGELNKLDVEQVKSEGGATSKDGSKETKKESSQDAEKEAPEAQERQLESNESRKAKRAKISTPDTSENNAGATHRNLTNIAQGICNDGEPESDEDASAGSSAIASANSRVLTPSTSSMSTPDRRTHAQTPLSDAPSPSAATVSNLDYKDIFSVYTFGSLYDFPKLKLDAIKCWQRLAGATNRLPETDLVSRAFEWLADDKHLTRLVARQFALNWSRSDAGLSVEERLANLEGVNHKFLILVMHFQHEAQADQNKRRGWCDFHDHASQEEAQACYRARVAELEEVEMRKRKGCWIETDGWVERVKKHNKLLNGYRSNTPSKGVIKLPIDKDGLVYE